MSTRTRVLVVDDSAFARKVLRDALGTSADIEVVAIARDGLEALEKIAELHPDVVTLDLVMPNLDGVGVLRALPGGPRPQVVVVSLSDAESELGALALQLGAVALVHKPTALATDRLYEMSAELVRAVKSAALARAEIRELPPAPTGVAPVPGAPSAGRFGTELLAIGTSTGGPQALTSLLPRLPADLPVPVVVVLHIPEEYTGSLARRLNVLCQLEVVEAAPGVAIEPGRVVIARGGLHLKVARRASGLVGVLAAVPDDALHRPSVDVLFESVAEVMGRHGLGVVLTGMGDDGLRGARRLRAAGGRVLTEAESSCVVYGMPRSVDEEGLSSGSFPLDRMADAILASL